MGVSGDDNRNRAGLGFLSEELLQFLAPPWATCVTLGEVCQQTQPQFPPYKKKVKSLSHWL